MVDHTKLHGQNIVACIWDFDKTLLNGYMQTPIFRHFGVDERTFWDEVNQLPARYAALGQKANKDTIYLNHLLAYVKDGPMRGLSNALLRELGAQLRLAPGLPHFFQELRDLPLLKPEYQKHGIIVEHYIVSTGLAEMIRGSAIAPFVEDIFACEFIETPFPAYFSRQPELPLGFEHREIAQIGVAVDNTTKTRYVFEINKGCNKMPDIDVNAKILHEDRRVQLKNMVYIADGPSDVPVFSVIRNGGGKTYAVYDPENPAEFDQNDSLLQAGRIHAYGPANYTPASSTHLWLRMHLTQIFERIVREQEFALQNRVSGPPKHLHKNPAKAKPDDAQADLFA